MMLTLPSRSFAAQASFPRSAIAPREMLAFGPVTLDVADRRLTVGEGVSRMLSPQETGLLAMLMRRPGVVIRASAVGVELWPDPDNDPEHLDRALRVIVCRLRSKLTAMNVEDFLIGSPRQGYRVEGLQRHVRLLSADEVPAVDALIARMRAAAAA